MCEVASTKSVQFRKKSVKTSLKLENVVTTFFIRQKVTKTLFSLTACKVANKIQICNLLLALEDIIGWKSDHICQFNEIKFSKDFGTCAFMTSTNQPSLGPMV